ncbi:hypothetical protein GCM10009347_03530 [Shewanella algicola]|uniref:hypothetical protein n=1 Tax=Shewanella algicola TaxID=640633 RepID=UPI0019C0B41B|nr:hypothetical protein GCM10009347_03530 [Shewanella algicola]
MIISEQQRKLAAWTATDKTRRVNRLLRLISHPHWLRQAAEVTLSSKGAKTPGVDGITKIHIQANLAGYLDEIRNNLLCQVTINRCLLDGSISPRPMESYVL